MLRYSGILALAALGTANAQTPKLGIKPPKLVLLVSIDQFRADYTERFSPYYLPAKSGSKVGGFRFLLEHGARYLDAHHNHIPTATGPGHATLMTGSEPTLDGIIGNNWFDKVAGKGIYCVDDVTVKVVGGGSSKPMSPKNLKVTTVGDELKMATGGRSRVVGISFKDRAAILMAGHAADTVIWLDGKTGGWISSSFYYLGGALPSWVEDLNSKHVPDNQKSHVWEPLLGNDAYALTRKNPGEASSSNAKPFSHSLAAEKNFISAFTTSDAGQNYVFQTVTTAIDAEKLGQHDVPDVLVMNLATNDYVGHRFGPNSPEVMDIAIRTDRLLSDLFNHLNEKVGLNNVDIVVTADHGVLPVPEESGDEYRTGSVRYPSPVAKAIEAQLVKKFGDGTWLLGDGLYEQNLFLNHETAKAKGVTIRDLETAAQDAAMNVPGVYVAFTRTQILHGEVPHWAWTDKVINGFHPTLGGDVMVLEAPGTLFDSGTGTSHGSAWAYDSHVPLLLHGPGIQAGTYGRSVATADIASTLCHLLGIEYPTGNVGTPLREALAVKN